MANNNLRQALTDADIQPEELAGILQVDERTIRRWLAGGTPYARHRARLARALDTTEQKLWPHLAASPAPDTTPPPPAVIDTVAGYADEYAPDAPATEAILADARAQIDLLADTSHELLDDPGLTELLLAKGREGSRVRILVSEPEHEPLEPLLGQPGIEIRRSEIDERPFIHRADDTILAWIFLTTDQEDEQPILLHVRRDQAPGLFDRLADHYQDAWEDAEPIESGDDIEYYLTERDGDYPEEHEPEPEDADPAQVIVQPPASALDSSGTEAAAAPARRWPGRQA